MQKSLQTSVGLLKAAKLLILIKIAFTVLRLIILFTSIFGVSKIAKYPELLHTLNEMNSKYIEFLSSISLVSNKLFWPQASVVVSLALIYFFYHFAIQKVEKTKNIKRWATLILIASALVISHDPIMMAVGLLGIASSAALFTSLEK